MTLRLKDDEGIPKRIVHKDNSLGSVMSAITIEESLDMSSSTNNESSFNNTPSVSLSGSKRYESRLEPKFESIKESRFDAMSGPRVIGTCDETSNKTSLSTSTKNGSKGINSSLNHHMPMSVPQRKPSEGNLVEAKRQQRLAAKMRGKKNQPFHYPSEQDQTLSATKKKQHPHRHSSPPRLMINSLLKDVGGGGTEAPLRIPERQPSEGNISECYKNKHRSRNNNKEQKQESKSRRNDIFDLTGSGSSCIQKSSSLSPYRNQRCSTCDNGIGNHGSSGVEPVASDSPVRKPERQPSTRVLTASEVVAHAHPPKLHRQQSM